jgi:hypothetical protein
MGISPPFDIHSYNLSCRRDIGDYSVLSPRNISELLNEFLKNQTNR